MAALFKAFDYALAKILKSCNISGLLDADFVWTYTE